jgi:hypothetical protein
VASPASAGLTGIVGLSLCVIGIALLALFGILEKDKR